MKRRGLLSVAAFVLGLLALSSAAQALTLSGIRTQIRRNVRDTSSDTTNQTFSDALILTYVNEAQKEINALTWSVEGSTSITLAAGTTYYSLPTNFLATKQVTFTRASTGQTVEIKELSERYVLQTNPDFKRIMQGPVVNYFTRQSPSGGTAMQLGTIPPASTTSTGTLTVQYFAQPTDLSSDSDVPFNGLLYLAPYHNLIVYQVTARLKAIQGKSDDSAAYMALYNSGIQLMSQRSSERPNFNPGAVGGTPNR